MTPATIAKLVERIVQVLQDDQVGAAFIGASIALTLAESEGRPQVLPTVELVERVAQAIHDGFPQPGSQRTPWAMLPSTIQDKYRASARAAIQAMQ